MAAVAMNVVEIANFNTIIGDGRTTAQKLVVLPVCAIPGKENECKQALEEILPKGTDFTVSDLSPMTSKPLFCDVSIGEPPVQWVSDLLVKRGVAVKWNMPDSR